jgi:hypothetical protein
MKATYSIVGMKHRGTEKLLASLPRHEPLSLVREPTNEHDPNAVKVMHGGTHIGYLAAKQIVKFVKWFDTLRSVKGNGYAYPAVLVFDGGGWPLAEVEE